MIEIWTEELPPQFHWKPDNYLGGTPETVVNLAENFDDDVFVYYDGKPCEHNGVYYLDRRDYLGNDILISINSKPSKLAKYNIAHTNWFHAREADYEEFDERVVISNYQKSLFGKNCRVVPLSCKKEDFKNPRKVTKQCLYSSSPDRGLDFLESGWDRVRDETGARLISTYSKDISDEEMIDLYKSSVFWLHPGEGIELFCISALKAQAAKCIPVVVPNMALNETVRYGVRTTKDNYFNDLIKAINDPINPEEIDFISWREVANQYLTNVGAANVS